MTAATFDTRRPIMVNGAAYRRQQNRREPDVTLTQSLIAGVVVALFAIAVLAIAVGVS
ncbi:hypothetical protein LB523_12275 [Mesorhizobium sp. ESP-6-4]|uniref:hypothetical protein n=1 Tax=Mesorhizobium sp. ESP-6-4 TaxID=2876624 RepID=UPI001CC9FD13|nr:hypothetical protein [Mesorhizobium sp. ESP-6-4]MBZ9659823.1 hypothetical protein [Mesorhizobium sp. ESP-6-4]